MPYILCGRLPPAKAREFQVRLDSIRSDYLCTTEGDRAMTSAKSDDITGRLDSLEVDLSRYR